MPSARRCACGARPNGCDNNQGRRGYDSGVWDILRVREEMRRLGVRRHVIAKDGTYRITLDGGNIDIFCADPFAAQ